MKKEMVAVVDKNDNVLGTKPRDKLAKTDLVRISVLWIENSRGEVLLQQRSLNKSVAPGVWGPTAGTVQAHQTYLTNIIDEAAEEIGLTGITPIEVGKRVYWEPNGPFGRIFMFFRVVVDQPVEEFTIQEEEVERLKWWDKQALIEAVSEHPELYVPSAVFWKEMYYLSA